MIQAEQIKAAFLATAFRPDGTMQNAADHLPQDAIERANLVFDDLVDFALVYMRNIMGHPVVKIISEADPHSLMCSMLCQAFVAGVIAGKTDMLGVTHEGGIDPSSHI